MHRLSIGPYTPAASVVILQLSRGFEDGFELCYSPALVFQSLIEVGQVRVEKDNLLFIFQLSHAGRHAVLVIFEL